ncbi:MAG TPA: hypothetical protein PKA62_01670 [Thermoanaerobaculia bacterium]|nr:hypothetical protein [Thermoanaerobaculia bacterium]
MNDVDVEGHDRNPREDGGDSPDDDELDAVAREELERPPVAVDHGATERGTT